ncbi:hypothetical protein HDN1F_20560 [gamma proteobacterium HdN1]|nr:hypothetical protein HDN1F_20560 [gamma proteobacterium HdN1]
MNALKTLSIQIVAIGLLTAASAMHANAEPASTDATATHSTTNHSTTGQPATTRYTLFHQVPLATLNQAAQTPKALQSPQAAPRDGYGDVTLYEAEVNLFDDFDGDGYYSRFEVSYDADDLSGGNGRMAYTRATVTSTNGDRYTLFTSQAFFIEPGNTRRDTQHQEIILLNDFPRGDYRLQIELFDADSSQLLDELNSDHRASLSLEGQYYDDSQHDDGGGSGGSLALLGVAGLGLLLLRSNRAKPAAPITDL